MNKNTLTALLTDLRALILKSRPAYRDFLGEVTEAKTTKILENVVLAESQLMLPVADAAFSGFIVGEAYRVVLNGEEKSVVAKDSINGPFLSNAEDLENLPNDVWLLGYNSEEGKMFSMAIGAFLGTTISVYYDETVTTQKWSVKKLAYELLPDRLLSALSAATNTARKALTAADAAQGTANVAQSTADAALNIADTAQSTANAAQSTANAAKTTADNAKTAANAAQSTANAAQSTANAAQSTANAAKILPVQYNYFAGLASKKNKFLGWYSFFPTLRYRSDGGFFFKSSWETEPLTKENIPSPFICSFDASVDGFSDAKFTLILVVTTKVGGNTWSVNGTAIANDGRIYRVNSNDIPAGSAQGIQLVFTPPTMLFLKSSTANSTKKFKITVDDAGTLSATEVTDTTT